MRKVDRTAVPTPTSLAGATSTGGRELIRARKRFGPQPTLTGAFAFKAYKGKDVCAALEALFHGKCAYCEAIYSATSPVDVEHYRPKKGVEDDDLHPGYWWLAMRWENLLPSCPDCNRRRYQPTPDTLSSLSALLEAQRAKGLKSIKTGKETCFPVRGPRARDEPSPADIDQVLAQEGALLLDPCTDDPSQHLRFYTDPENPIGVVFAAPDDVAGAGALPALSSDVQQIEREARAANVSVRGSISIQVYGLNRLGLVQERTRVLRDIEYNADMYLQLSKMLEEVEASGPAVSGTAQDQQRKHLREQVQNVRDKIVSMAAPRAPFSAMASAWLEAFGVQVEASSTTATAALGSGDLVLAGHS